METKIPAVDIADLAAARWNAKADEYNQWDALGQDEKDELITAEKNLLASASAEQEQSWRDQGRAAFASGKSIDSRPSETENPEASYFWALGFQDAESKLHEELEAAKSTVEQGASATLVALKMVVNALDVVEAHSGRLPTYDDPLEDDDTPPQTFLQLTQQFAGDHVSEAELLKVIDAMPALFPAYHFPWK